MAPVLYFSISAIFFGVILAIGVSGKIESGARPMLESIGFLQSPLRWVSWELGRNTKNPKRRQIFLMAIFVMIMLFPILKFSELGIDIMSTSAGIAAIITSILYILLVFVAIALLVISIRGFLVRGSHDIVWAWEFGSVPSGELSTEWYVCREVLRWGKVSGFMSPYGGSEMLDLGFVDTINLSDDWKREFVQLLCDAECLVAMTNMCTENILWEIEAGVKLLGPDKVVVIDRNSTSVEMAADYGPIEVVNAADHLDKCAIVDSLSGSMYRVMGNSSVARRWIYNCIYILGGVCFAGIGSLALCLVIGFLIQI